MFGNLWFAVNQPSTNIPTDHSVNPFVSDAKATA